MSPCVSRHHVGRVFGAETGFRLERDPDTVIAPDVAFVAAGRLPPGGAASWLALGARMVWVVNPRARTVALHEPGEPCQVLQEPGRLRAETVLPGFDCAVGTLFES